MKFFILKIKKNYEKKTNKNINSNDQINYINSYVYIKKSHTYMPDILYINI